MEKFDLIKKRLESAVQDGVVDHERQAKKARQYINELIKGPGKYRRLVAALSLASEVMPKSFHTRLAAKLDEKDFSGLPISPEKFTVNERVGRGYINKVYLMEAKSPDNPSYVLKINTFERGEADELARTAEKEHREYEYLRARYRDLPTLIPNEQSLIVAARGKGKPVIAVVQEFLGRDVRDVFKDIDREELIALCRENEAFREEFDTFVAITRGLAETKGEIIDLIGDKNLVVVEDNGRPALRFLDPHNITATPSDDSDLDDRLQEALDYLVAVKAAVDSAKSDERLAA